MSERPVIAWFDRDLRLADQPMLAAAAACGRPTIPLFILDEAGHGAWPPGAASRWWLHHSLAALQRGLADLGLPLVLRRGPAEAVLRDLLAETGAAAVHWCRRYEPALRARDRRIGSALAASGVEARSFDGGLLCEPEEARTAGGRPFRVFGPYWRAVLARGAPPQPEPAARPAPPAAVPGGDHLDAWGLRPTRPDWAGGLREAWRPGEAGARERLRRFLDEDLRGYRRLRDRPDRQATSRLSPHLHFGELSARTIWHAVATRTAADATLAGDAEAFLRELGWREFSYQLLVAHDRLPEEPLRAEFTHFPWRRAAGELRAWQHGLTGYPIVDAGMRQLWRTGWMHNRVRMIVASFLVKDLLVPWQEGEAWFWDTLVDADLASNAASWQWVAGCGADAAPYFRVFNPVLQGAKFDPDGGYVRRFVPELARLPAAHIHRPWAAPPAILAAAGLRLGTDYPAPIVDHAAARRRALEAFG
ncbi:MAG: deoxyribodipyrimidine photo-lyase, partial [Alphaproteobacteria bacterium]|nr:deoxyribodipyrimidine photo-lyase [Alphaproteobacteria bacterium]